MEEDNKDLLGRLKGVFGIRRPRRDLMREMVELIEEGSAEGLINSDEGEMLRSVLDFRTIMVREVMVPRTEMVCIEVGEPLSGLIKLIIEEGHSRLPVYEGGIDHVVGVVHARDILPYWDKEDEPPGISELMHDAYFVPETMSLETLLGEFKLRKTHLAVAVDEYGGVSGLITLEDVLEEIVGDIQDEYDEEEPSLIRHTNDGIEVDGRCEIEELEQELGRPLEAPGEFETVGGLVFSVMGRIPKPGESFTHDGLNFAIRDADERRIKSVVVFGPVKSSEETTKDAVEQ